MHQGTSIAEVESAPARLRQGTAPRQQHLPHALARETVLLVSRHRNIPLPLLLRPSRGAASVAEARQIAMYLMHVVLRRTYAEIGFAFGRDRTTVAHACARVEDLRDLPHIDQELNRLEQLLTLRLQRRFAIHAAA